MRKFLLVSVFTGSFFAFLYLAGFIYFSMLLPSAGTENYINETDGVVVFTGGSKRVEAAIALLENGYKKPVLISGVNPKVTKQKLMGHLPAEIQNFVTLDYDSLSTKQNVEATKLWANSKGLKSISLITSFYHMPRSLMYWGRGSSPVNDNIDVKPYPVFPGDMPLSFLLREYNKYALTFLHII